MAGSVPAERSKSPGWLAWTTFTVLFLMFVLVSWLYIFAFGLEEDFIYHVIAATVIAALILPAWAIFHLSKPEDEPMH